MSCSMCRGEHSNGVPHLHFLSMQCNGGGSLLRTIFMIYSSLASKCARPQPLWLGVQGASLCRLQASTSFR